MKLVRWEFLGLHMPMMEDEDGELYCTSKAICNALGLSKDALDHIVTRNAEEFGSLRLTNCQSKDDGPSLPNLQAKDGNLSVTNCYSKDLSVSNPNAKEFFTAHKTEFGIKRVRSDMRLWSEDDMLTFAFHSKSPQSLEFRKQLRKFIKQNATRGYVTQAQFDELKGQMHSIMELVAMYVPAANEAASSAGKALRAQRSTKPLRLVTLN